jgi:hypothetical protein
LYGGVTGSDDHTTRQDSERQQTQTITVTLPRRICEMWARMMYVAEDATHINTTMASRSLKSRAATGIMPSGSKLDQGKLQLNMFFPSHILRHNRRRKFIDVGKAVHRPLRWLCYSGMRLKNASKHCHPPTPGVLKVGTSTLRDGKRYIYKQDDGFCPYSTLCDTLPSAVGPRQVSCRVGSVAIERLKTLSGNKPQQALSPSHTGYVESGHVCSTWRRRYIYQQDDGFFPYSARSPQQSGRGRYHAE